MKGYSKLDVYRIRVNGGYCEHDGTTVYVSDMNYRIIFAIETNRLVVLITDVDTRSRVYKRPYYQNLNQDDLP